MPVFETIETILTSRLKILHGVALRVIARSAYVGNKYIHLIIVLVFCYDIVNGVILFQLLHYLSV